MPRTPPVAMTMDEVDQLMQPGAVLWYYLDLPRPVGLVLILAREYEEEVYLHYWPCTDDRPRLPYHVTLANLRGRQQRYVPADPATWLIAELVGHVEYPEEDHE